MAASRKVLVTGASGLLGRQIYASLKDNGWDTLGLAYSRTGNGLMKADITNSQEMKQIFEKHQPQVVIHSAAERRPDIVQNEPDKAKTLNVTATDHLTQLCREFNSFLIYISTDYVFDGTTPPYRHDDTPNPLNTYGQLKLDGEKVVSTYRNSAIVRVPILYGPIESLDESAVTILFKALLSTDPARMSDYERRYPTHTCDVGRFIEQLATKGLENREIFNGIWHFSNTECFTKYQMILIMGKIFNFSVDHLIAVGEPSGGTPRPYDNQFELSKTREHFKMDTMISLENGLKNVLKPFLPHNN